MAGWVIGSAVAAQPALLAERALAALAVALAPTLVPPNALCPGDAPATPCEGRAEGRGATQVDVGVAARGRDAQPAEEEAADRHPLRRGVVRERAGLVGTLAVQEAEADGQLLRVVFVEALAARAAAASVL